MEQFQNQIRQLEIQINNLKEENLQKSEFIKHKNVIETLNTDAVISNVLSSKSSSTSSATPECFEIIESNIPNPIIEDNTSCSSCNENDWIKLEENKHDGQTLSIIEIFHHKLKNNFSNSER